MLKQRPTQLGLVRNTLLPVHGLFVPVQFVHVFNGVTP
jgi:hypothetical protein